MCFLLIAVTLISTVWWSMSWKLLLLNCGSYCSLEHSQCTPVWWWDPPFSPIHQITSKHLVFWDRFQENSSWWNSNTHNDLMKCIKGLTARYGELFYLHHLFTLQVRYRKVHLPVNQTGPKRPTTLNKLKITLLHLLLLHPFFGLPLTA